MRFSAPSRVDAVALWYRSGAKATNPAVASRSHRPLKKSFRPHHAWRTRRAGPLPVFGTARYPETFPSGLLSSTIVIFHIAVTGEWPIRHLNLRLNGHRRSTPPVRTQKEDGSDSNTRLPHSTIRRSSQYSVKCRKPAARWCEESGLLKGLPPIWRLALHDGHPFDHAREGPRVPTTCHVPAQALTAGPSRRCRLRGTSRQRSSIRGPGAPRARKGRIGIRLEGSSVRSGVGSKGLRICRSKS